MRSPPRVKNIVLPLIGFLFSVPALTAENNKQPTGTKELRNECHAFFYYTAALAQELHNTRKELLSRAIDLNPHLARAFYNRGYLYMDEGDLLRARADFKQAVDLDGSYINAHYNLACVYSMESRPAESLAALEQALAIGYSKFDKLPDDSDLKNIKNNPAFAPLIAKYRERRATTKLNVLSQFQTTDLDGRLALLDDAIRQPDKDSQKLAFWAMHEPDWQARVLAMQLLRKIDVEQSRPRLLCGLYDANGYVNKAAGNCLVGYGKDIAPLMIWILGDKGTGAPFYALQILAAIKPPKVEASVVPFLRDDEANVRMVAAECLARLGAVSEIAQIQAALERLPERKDEQEFYKSQLNRAINELKQAKDNKGRQQRQR